MIYEISVGNILKGVSFGSTLLVVVMIAFI